MLSKERVHFEEDLSLYFPLSQMITNITATTNSKYPPSIEWVCVCVVYVCTTLHNIQCTCMYVVYVCTTLHNIQCTCMYVIVTYRIQVVMSYGAGTIQSHNGLMIFILCCAGWVGVWVCNDHCITNNEKQSVQPNASYITVI